jgi:hypothetical protein
MIGLSSSAIFKVFHVLFPKLLIPAGAGEKKAVQDETAHAKVKISKAFWEFIFKHPEGLSCQQSHLSTGK